MAESGESALYQSQVIVLMDNHQGAFVVLAQQVLPRFEITPFAGYRIGGTFVDSISEAEIKLDEGSSFGISLNMRAEANTQYEVTFSHQDTKFDIGSLAAPTLQLQDCAQRCITGLRKSPAVMPRKDSAESQIANG